MAGKTVSMRYGAAAASPTDAAGPCRLAVTAGLMSSLMQGCGATGKVEEAHFELEGQLRGKIEGVLRISVPAQKPVPTVVDCTQVQHVTAAQQEVTTAQRASCCQQQRSAHHFTVEEVHTALAAALKQVRANKTCAVTETSVSECKCQVQTNVAPRPAVVPFSGMIAFDHRPMQVITAPVTPVPVFDASNIVSTQVSTNVQRFCNCRSSPFQVIQVQVPVVQYQTGHQHVQGVTQQHHHHYQPRAQTYCSGSQSIGTTSYCSGSQSVGSHCDYVQSACCGGNVRLPNNIREVALRTPANMQRALRGLGAIESELTRERQARIVNFLEEVAQEESSSSNTSKPAGEKPTGTTTKPASEGSDLEKALKALLADINN